MSVSLILRRGVYLNDGRGVASFLLAPGLFNSTHPEIGNFVSFPNYESRDSTVKGLCWKPVSRSQKLHSSCNAKHSPAGSTMLSVDSLDTQPKTMFVITNSKRTPRISDIFFLLLLLTEGIQELICKTGQV